MSEPSSPAPREPEPARRDVSGRLALRVGLVVAAAFVIIDQATKQLAETLLAPGRFVPLVGDAIGWQLVYNPGGAFGFGAPSWLFLAVTVLVTIIVLRALPDTSSLLQATAYGLLLAGAIGNVLDRLLRAGAPDGRFGGGYVVDFVAWGTFPRFNVADSAITVGFVLLVIALWIEERRSSDAGDGERPSADPEGPSADPERSSADPETPTSAPHDDDPERR